MTDEEKAEEYVKTNHSHIMSGTMKSIYKKIYLAGLAEARKEYSEIPCTSCCITESLESDFADLNYQFVELKKDKEYLDKVNNEQTEVILQLNEQIEKMKRCKNCKYSQYISCPILHAKQCSNYSKWELAE